MIKRFTLLLFCSMMVLMAQAQSPRMTFVEEGTQASCPPCFTANPILQALLNENTDKAIFMAYQTSWPGVDAMNADNPEEVQARIQTYYGINGVPDVAINGTVFDPYQGPAAVTQAGIDEIYAEMSEFDLVLSASIENGTMTITGTATATQEVSGDLKLRLAINEKLIVNADLPYLGTNGETEFHHVMKKFVGGTEGFTLSDTWAVGDVYEINETIDMSTINVYNFGELEVIAFIQDDATKFVHQAAKTSSIDITVDLQNNVAGDAVGGFPSNVCAGTQTIEPTFELRNNGNLELTSATVTYNVNGGTDATFEWTGSLATYYKALVTLPAISYEPAATNVVNITVSNPNNETDEDTSDDVAISEEFTSLLGEGVLTVEVLTDNFADEVYWQVTDGSGTVVGFGGNPNVGLDNINTGTYPAPTHPDMYANNTLYTTEVPVDADGCYTFTITDYFGDGLSLSQTPGYYSVTSADGVTMAIGVQHNTPIENHDFQEKFVVDIAESLDLNTVSVYPNPAQNFANVNFTLTNSADCAVTIVNSIGQTVYTKNLGTITTGEYTENVDFSNFAEGLYFVEIRVNNDVTTQKVTHIK